MALFDTHRNVITAFPGRSVSGWTVSLNTWNKTIDSEDKGSLDDTTDKSRTDKTSRRPVKYKQTNLYIIELDTINLEEFEMDEGLTIYEKMWGASALDHSIDMNQAFWVGWLLKAISRRQEKAVDLWGTLCRDVSSDQVWVDESILYTNLQLAEIEAQDVSHFPE